MKKIAFLLLLAAGAVSAQTWVDGYTRKDGTYVLGHYRSDGNSTKSDNYGSQGNTNPYTGEKGTRRDEPRTPVCGYTQAGRYVCQ